MCFRPADISMGLSCPECGKKINSVQGVYPKKCPFCKTSFEQYLDDSGQLLDAPVSPGAPVAPSVAGVPAAPAKPGAPKMPGAPAVPGIPKMPGAPKPPSA